MAADAKSEIGMKRCCRQDRVCAAFFVTTTVLFPPAIEIRIEASTVKILLDLHQPSRKLIGMPWNPGRGRLPGFEGRRSQKNERFRAPLAGSSRLGTFGRGNSSAVAGTRGLRIPRYLKLSPYKDH